ncbi:CPBP family intramembrane glutamic endopeptidase [Bacillus pinisoli]|uniref:CPBP family intramembrane glutamic endopeptidase n=1 Tax=Bacillus pinisoli TaxID=2901866 RepID=UPI001FF34F17|nr:CPBP family intramembrane glutamic endopeptidase [Bacillus pinisoli]
MKDQSELIKQMSDREVLFHLYLTQFLLLTVATIAAYFLFDTDSFQSIWQLDITEILLYGGATGLTVIFFDLWLMKVLPKRYFDDGGINDRVFQSRSFFHIFVLCWLIAFAEEWLFRGVIQTHFGIVVASITFALLHVRYLKKWVLFIIVTTLSFLLGILYEVTENLWVTIFAHFLIDFVFGIKISLDYRKKSKEG